MILIIIRCIVRMVAVIANTIPIAIIVDNDGNDKDDCGGDGDGAAADDDDDDAYKRQYRWLCFYG